MAIGLIVGLGNPGASYENNRHNVGFRVIDSLASGRCEFRSMASLAKLGVVKDASAENLLLAKPTTFMNLSGQAVQFLAKFYKIVPENILVIHDDIDLNFGNVRAKLGGGHGGHNGLKSIDGAIGSNYWRLRIGVGRPPMKSMVTSYVLGDFDSEQREYLDKLLLEISKQLALLQSDPIKLAAQLNNI